MESDLSLIKKIQSTQDKNCLDELINRHSGIYIYIVDKFTKNKDYNVDRETILSEKDYMIYKSALDYDPNKNSKFSTYLANQTKWKCLNEINAIRNKRMVSIDTLYSTASGDETSHEILCKIESFDIFNSVLEEETDLRVKKIIDIRFNTDNNRLRPWREVSKELNMSIQGCINIYNRFINKVKNKFDKNYV